MKILTFAAIASSTLVLFSSCSNDSRLRERLEKEAAEYPMEIVPGFTLESVTDDGTNVNYRYVYTDSVFNPRTNIERFGEQGARDISLRTLRDNESSRPFFEEVVEAGRGLRFVYVARQTKDSTVLEMPAENVRRIADEKKD